MIQQLTLAELINAAIEAENTARKIYIGFTYRFASEPQASDFWQSMADEEATHAKVLSRLRDHVFEDHLNLPVDARLAEKVVELKKIDVKELVNSVRNLDDAYKITFDLESSEINTIFNFLTIRYMPTDESYDIITSAIDRHLLRLAEFSHMFGNAQACQQIVVTA